MAASWEAYQPTEKHFGNSMGGNYVTSAISSRKLVLCLRGAAGIAAQPSDSYAAVPHTLDTKQKETPLPG